jgi:site-specific DNA recombinase
MMTVLPEKGTPNREANATCVSTKVAAYCRVSTEDQAERETVQNQVEFAKSYCELYDIAVHDFYLDDGVSGTLPLWERPEGSRLMRDAEQGLFSQILVYRIDRFGRRLVALVEAVDRLEALGVAVKSMTEPFETSTAMGRFVMQLLGSLAELERETILERTMMGRRRAARTGRWCGGFAPLGYRLEPTGETYKGRPIHRLAVDDAEAETVRLIFRLYTRERTGSVALADYLNANGVPTLYLRRRMKSKRVRNPGVWDSTRVCNVLRNETYAGVHHWGKRGKGEAIGQEIPPIIDRSTWEEAARLRRENHAWASRNAKRNYLLRGLIRCGACGRRYVGRGHRSKGQYYYRCTTPKCSSPGLRADVLEGLVWADVEAFLSDPGPVLALLAEKLQAANDSVDQRRVQEDVESRIVSAQTGREAVLRQLRKGTIKEAEAETALEEAERELESLRAEAERVAALVEGEEVGRTALLTAKHLLERLRAKLESIDDDTRRDLITCVVAAATVDVGENGATEVKVTYFFPEGPIARNPSGR